MASPTDDRLSPPLVVGVTGSSAPQLAWSFLSALRSIPIATHVVVSHGARRSIELELRRDADELTALADCAYDDADLAAPISSGSFVTMGMVVIPCSMHTLGAIASGNSSSLITRAADVCLKERRRLVLVPRETPLNLIHLRNMETLTLAGATILPPVPAFYHRPETIDDLLAQTSGKVLDQFGIDHSLYRRWSGG